MSGKIIQLNFKFSVSGSDYEQAVTPLASQFAAVAGLRWKIWMINEAESEAGGFYMFDDEASLNAFLEGPLAAQVTSHPALSEFSVKQFDVMEDLTAITRGPVEKGVSA
ncbi:MAG: YdhR family protein [Chloroflexi bacterium]|nr:YdhR family protein [Chloroflexota bacterium]